MNFLIAGDSHARYFQITPQLKTIHPALLNIQTDVQIFTAATITGFGKRESTLNVSSRLLEKIDHNAPDLLVLNFGQVDIELGIPYRRYVKGDTRDFRTQTKSLIDAYQSFIDKIQLPNDRIIVKGINLPVLCYDRNKAIKYVQRIVTENIEDPESSRQILNRMRKDFSSDIQRTVDAEAFNQLLNTSLREIGVRSFDINSSLRDESTSLISTTFIPSRRDHHLADSLAVRRLHWQELLNALPALP